MILETQNLSLGFGSKTILANVNLVIDRGEWWFFLGPNGHGKTTFLKALMGSHPIQGGCLNRKINEVSSGTTAYIPQRWEIGRHIPTTVREFVMLGLVGLQISRHEAAKRLTWVLEQVGLEAQLQKSFWALSGGQRQRALVARALVRKPKILFADEPTNHLDFQSETQLLELLKKLNQEEAMTLILVTHNQTLARRYATHIAFIQNSQVLSGTQQNMFTSHLKENS